MENSNTEVTIKVNNGSSDYYNDPRSFVRTWTTNNKITFRAKGEMYCGGQPQDTEKKLATMWLDYRQQLPAYNSTIPQKIKGFTKDDLKLALGEFIHEQAAKAIIAKRKEIRCITPNLEPLKKFVLGLTWASEDLVVGILAHFLWQIKRKFYGLPVTDHLMPVLFGPQGRGKTTAIFALVELISDWRADIKLNAVNDDRYDSLFEENYLVAFEELQNAKSTDIDNLKNKISATKSNPRTLNTHLYPRKNQNCTFIGSSNTRLDEQIIDNSGMRRFAEIEVPKHVNRDIINNLNYLELWCGIDENRYEGYLDLCGDALKIAQDDLTGDDAIRLFIQEYRLAEDGPKTAISAGLMYKVYTSWATINGYKAYDSGTFGRRLKNRGVARGRETRQGRQQRVYLISETAQPLFEGCIFSAPENNVN